MVSPGGVLGIAVLIAVHTLLAGIATRFIRLYADTRVGTALAIATAIPIVLFLSTLVLSGPLQLGFDLQDRWLAAMIAIGLPLALGLTIDFLWVASPEEVEAELAG